MESSGRLESGFYLFDGIHNVRQLTDSSQVVTDEYAFDAWGNTTSSTGSTANSQLYNGRLLSYRNDLHAGPDTQTSTHFRNPSAQTGRFTSEDPAADDHNLYRPVGSNPVKGEDPSGLQVAPDDTKLPIPLESPRSRNLFQAHLDRIRNDKYSDQELSKRLAWMRDMTSMLEALPQAKRPPHGEIMIARGKTEIQILYAHLEKRDLLPSYLHMTYRSGVINFDEIH